MLKIEMPRKELTIAPEVTVGNRTRYSTATAVAFINENLFVSAAFNSRKLYLVEITSEGHNILQEVKTKHAPDLMKYKDGVIITSDYPYLEPNGHASLYDFIDGRIVFRKDIPVVNTKVHGCEIVDKDTVIITSNSDHNRGIIFLNVANGAIKQNFNNIKHYPKDVCIVGDVLFTVCAESLPQIGKTTVIKESILYAFNKNTFEKIDEVVFHGQTDSIVVNGEDGFVTIQGDDTVLHFKFVDNKLSIVKRIGGFSFPHGIDYKNNKVAVTNYGDNTIRIFDVDELKNL
jgi:DNA-binding beta-propeller fold protein YncE